MERQNINKEEYLILAKGLQEIQNTALKYKSLTIGLFPSKYKTPKQIGGDGLVHSSIEIRVYFSNRSNIVAYTFDDWDKKKCILNTLDSLESELKGFKEITDFIDCLKIILS